MLPLSFIFHPTQFAFGLGCLAHVNMQTRQYLAECLEHMLNRTVPQGHLPKTCNLVKIRMIASVQLK